jgi:CheY-like chemotaxis protein
MSPATAVPSPASKTILVVEDDDMLREVLERILQRSGFAGLGAEPGAAALERFRAAPIDHVVTDKEMPQSDGFELIAALLRERPDAAIIAISGAERVLRDPHAVERLGIRMLLEKPVSGPDLVEAVRRTLAPS